MTTTPRTSKRPSLLAEYLTAAETAAALGVAGRTLKRWQTEGSGPPSLKLGAHRVYHRASVMRWLAGKEAPAGPTRRRQRKAVRS